MINARAVVVLLVAMLTFVGACSKAPETDKAKPAQELRPARTTKAEGLGNLREYYDKDSNLLASDEMLAGLRLPKGLFFYRNSGLTRVYRSRVPIAKLLSYLGPLLITTDVDTNDHRTVYNFASVQGPEADSSIHLTV